MGKRANGEGSIYYSAKQGLWRGAVQDPVTGKRVYVSGRTQTVVLEKLKKVRRRVDQGLTPTDSTMKLSAWLDRYLADVVRPNLRPSTVAGYEQMVRLYITPGLGRHRLDRLTPAHVRHWQNEMATDGRAPRTRRYAFAVLRRSLEIAVKDGLLVRNVAAVAGGPRLDHREQKVLTPDQVRTVLQTAEAEADGMEARWHLALLGLRQGETLGLSWEHMDLDTGTVVVRQALQRVKGEGLVIGPVKSRTSNRTLRLPKPVVESLRRRRRVQAEHRLAAGEQWADEHSLVFTSDVGAPIDPSADRRAWSALLDSAGVPHVRLHDARHSYATLLLSQGVPIGLVAQSMGHSSITLVHSTYGHVIDEMRSTVADAAQKAMFEPPFGRSKSNQEGNRYS